MKYADLGKSDLKVSRICMGCMGFGNAAIACQSGSSEQYVEKALRDFARRTAPAPICI